MRSTASPCWPATRWCDRPPRRWCGRLRPEVRYDRLLLATGSKPFIIPVPGHTLDGVIAFRDIQDVETMLHAARNHRHAVVIGGGLLGLEAANGLMRQGMDVTVVHLADSLMNRQLDKPAAALLKGAGTQGPALPAERADRRNPRRGPRDRRAFKDGTQIPADLVVMTAGVRPNIELAASAGLRCERAIVVDDTLQTFDPRIYAVGECVQHRQATFGLVAPIWDQARVRRPPGRRRHRRYVQQATPPSSR
jgi:nitrite reductase (NADH) large subunit